jgi:hypothetical protein
MSYILDGISTPITISPLETYGHHILLDQLMLIQMVILTTAS